MDRHQKFIQEKAKKKRELLGSMFFPRTPVLLLNFSDAKKCEEYADILDGMEAIKLTTLILAPKNFRNLPSGKFLHYITDDKEKSALVAADFALIWDSDINSVSKHGCVPIAKANGDETVDYNPLLEKGNGFYYKDINKWEIFAAIVRACETYQFPYDWENLIKGILGSK